jgi:hypothetical protein
MSHTDIIIITGTLLLSSTVGIYAVLKYINLHTRPPVNSLIRSTRDIELQDYIERDSNLLQVHIEPSRVPCTSEATYNSSEGITSSFSANPPSYNTLDLLQPEQVHILSERVTTYIPIYSNSDTTNCFSEDSLNLERFPEYYINCCLEDTINLDYFILFLVLTIIFYFTIYNKNKILSLINNLLYSHFSLKFMIILAILIQFQFGFLVLTQISILLLIFILSNSLLGLNPNEK